MGKKREEVEFSFAITEKELKRALKFAKKKGTSDNNTIMFEVGPSNGIGRGFTVSSNGKHKDITDVGSW